MSDSGKYDAWIQAAVPTSAYGSDAKSWDGKELRVFLDPAWADQPKAKAKVVQACREVCEDQGRTLTWVKDADEADVRIDATPRPGHQYKDPKTGAAYQETEQTTQAPVLKAWVDPASRDQAKECAEAMLGIFEMETGCRVQRVATADEAEVAFGIAPDRLGRTHETEQSRAFKCFWRKHGFGV